MVESKEKLFGLARTCSITLAVGDTSLERYVAQIPDPGAGGSRLGKCGGAERVL